MAILHFLADVFAYVLLSMPWYTGKRDDRRAIARRQVRSGLRSVEGRVLNIGTEWSTGRCEITPGHLTFIPNMGIVGPREIDVLAVEQSEEDFERMVVLPSRPTTTLLVRAAAGDLYWQVPVRVVDEAIELLGLTNTEICPGCGHPMSDHTGPNGEFVSIPVDDPPTGMPEQSERDHLWELHDRGYMTDEQYETEMRRLGG